MRREHEMKVNGQSHTPAVYPGEKSPRFPLNRKPGGPQSLSGAFEGERVFVKLAIHELGSSC